MSDSQRTPADSFYGVSSVNEKLDRIEAHCAAAANNSWMALTKVDALARDFQSLTSRVTALEVSGRWAPLIISSISLAVSLWAMGHR